MSNIRLTLSYLGTLYLGWQKTRMGPSIEEALEKALSQILQESISLQAASRTDAGVHAKGQVVNFLTEHENLDLKRLHKSLNGLLPKEISVIDISFAPDPFHPTLDVLGKEYHYHLCNSPIQLPFYRHVSWHFPSPLDLQKMQDAAQLLIGKHDFSAFCNERALLKKEAIREIYRLEVKSLPEERLCIQIHGNHFLYKMVRNIVGTLAYVGCGKILLENVSNILKSKDRTQAGVTAPAHGLTLKKVFY